MLEKNRWYSLEGEERPLVGWKVVVAYKDATQRGFMAAWYEGDHFRADGKPIEDGAITHFMVVSDPQE